MFLIQYFYLLFVTLFLSFFVGFDRLGNSFLQGLMMVSMHEPKEEEFDLNMFTEALKILGN